MKTKNWLWLIIAVFGLSFYACSDSNNGVRIGNVSYFFKDTESNSAIGNQSVTYEVKDGILNITITNYLMNGAAEGIDVKIQYGGLKNEFTLIPYDLGMPFSSSLRPIDITTTVAGLEYGETYQCTLEHMDLSFSFTCKNGVKGTVEE